MDRRLIILLLLLLVGGGGYFVYRAVAAHQSMSNGEVHIRTPGADDPRASGSANVALTPEQSAGSPGSALEGPPPLSQAAPGAVPPTDTLSANPPNGMAFGGRGTYQWYRQGNVTWRLNTQSGRSCIAYATMEEWAKPLVAGHGCGRTG